MTTVEFTDTKTGPDSPEQVAHQDAQQPANTQDTQNDTDGNMYAGKFKSVEDLEKAYAEATNLISKGAHKETPEEETTSVDKPTETEETPEDKPTEDNNYGPAVTNALQEAGLDGNDLSQEFQDNNGDLTEESYAALDKAGYPKDVVKAYLKGITSTQTEAQKMADDTVTEIMDSVGGSDDYGRMVSWMVNNLPEADVQNYDKAVSTNDPYVAKLVVKSMHDKYVQAVGKEANPVSGKQSTASVKGYRSKEEMMRDMKSAKYSDPAFQAEVDRKIAASNFV